MLLVLHTDRPRPTGLAFMAGWLVALIIGTAAAGATARIAVAFHTVLAGSTVIAPILAHVVAGSRVDAQLERVRDWMAREHATVTADILLVVGVLTYTGIRAL